MDFLPQFSERYRQAARLSTAATPFTVQLDLSPATVSLCAGLLHLLSLLLVRSSILVTDCCERAWTVVAAMSRLGDAALKEVRSAPTTWRSPHSHVLWDAVRGMRVCRRHWGISSNY